MKRAFMMGLQKERREKSFLKSRKQSIKELAMFQTKSHNYCNHSHQFIQSQVINPCLLDLELVVL